MVPKRWFLRRAKSVWKQVFCRCERKKKAKPLFLSFTFSGSQAIGLDSINYLALSPASAFSHLALFLLITNRQNCLGHGIAHSPLIHTVQASLWPLSLVCVRSSLQPPSRMPSVLCLLHTPGNKHSYCSTPNPVGHSLEILSRLWFWLLHDSGIFFIVCLFYCLTS